MMHSVRNLLLLGLLAGSLVGCAATKPQPLPNKANITPGKMVVVKGNENIYQLAQENGVSMQQIIVLNNLPAPYVLRPGQQIILPAKPGERAGDVAPPPDAAPSGVIERQQLNGMQPVPLSGGPQGALMPQSTYPQGANGFINGPKPSGTELPPLQTVPIAPPAVAAPAPAATLSQGANNLAAPSPATQPNSPLALNTPPQKPVPPTTTVPTAAAPVASASAPDTAVSTPADAPSASLVWPVQGQIISGYGPKAGGMKNDGVNIAAPKGSPVTAAGNGIVVFAGDEMKGFGNLILIRHGNGLVTAYAHLDRMLVGKDATVVQGDMIGTIGKTGNVPSPQLHFEVRKDGKPIDPSGVVKTSNG